MDKEKDNNTDKKPHIIKEKTWLPDLSNPMFAWVGAATCMVAATGAAIGGLAAAAPFIALAAVGTTLIGCAFFPTLDRGCKLWALLTAVTLGAALIAAPAAAPALVFGLAATSAGSAFMSLKTQNDAIHNKEQALISEWGARAMRDNALIENDKERYQQPLQSVEATQNIVPQIAPENKTPAASVTQRITPKPKDWRQTALTVRESSTPTLALGRS